MSSGRGIQTLPLAQVSIDALLTAGFTSVGDLCGVTPLDLRKETGLSLEDANLALLCVKSFEGNIHQPAGNLLRRVLSGEDTSQSIRNTAESKDDRNEDPTFRTLVSSSYHEPQTMRALLAKVGKTDSIITFCRNLDKLMGGGVPLGSITEFVGAPGVGKTQLSIQLALDTQIPALFSGVGGSTIYIDSEGSFWPQRAYAMAQALSAHLVKIANIKPRGLKLPQGLSADEAKLAQSNAEAALLQQRLTAAKEMTPERLLAGIQVMRVHTQSDLISAINNLPAYITKQNAAAASRGGGVSGIGPVRLVVIDSIAFHFRHDLSDTKARSRLLVMQANKLHELAVYVFLFIYMLLC